MLIDQAKIYVSGGKGGNGCQSLQKDIFHRKGIPDGGDGGCGGNIVVRSDLNLHTLLDFRYNQHYSAENGKHGGSNKKYGRTGKDLIVKVPRGTILRDADSGLVIRDLASEGEQVVVARGGAGGKGSAKRREATPGEEGEKKTVLLELKLVADVGVIGLPNAGKSTLVSCITRSHTKIAPYPFTTKEPKLGVVRFHEDSFVIADMPGLIEGAHSGKGLGDRFLKHIERTQVLVHLVDMAPLDGTDPVDNYFRLEEELKLYSREVHGKPRVVVANKMDMPGAGESLRKFAERSGKKIIAVSALQKTGLDELVKVVYGEICHVRQEKEDQENNR